MTRTSSTPPKVSLLCGGTEYEQAVFTEEKAQRMVATSLNTSMS